MTNPKLRLICVLTIIILMIDLALPLGVAGGVPYIVVILISLWIPQPKIEIHLAIVCSVLVIFGFYFSPSGGELWKVLMNRGLALFAIWVTALIGVKWKKTKELLFEKTLLVETEKKKIYQATIYASQHVINNLLNQLLYVKLNLEEENVVNQDILSVLDTIQEESLNLMQKLSSLEDVDDQKIKKSVLPSPNQIDQ